MQTLRQGDGPHVVDRRAQSRADWEPVVLSAAFWGGLWGVAYAFMEPSLTARLGRWSGGLVFGAVLPLLVLWFVVSPLKGLPIGGGFALSGVLQGIALHAFFGLGASIFFGLGLHLVGQRAPITRASPESR